MYIVFIIPRILNVKEDLVRPRVIGGVPFAPPTYRPASPSGSSRIDQEDHGADEVPNGCHTPALTIQYDAVLHTAPTACFLKAARWADAVRRQRDSGSPSRVSDQRTGDRRFPCPKVGEGNVGIRPEWDNCNIKQSCLNSKIRTKPSSKFSPLYWSETL